MPGDRRSHTNWPGRSSRHEPEPAPKTAPPSPRRLLAAPPAVGLAGTVHALQRTAGNAATAAMVAPVTVSRAAVVTYHSEADIKAMTLSDFDGYAQKQADWENEPGRPAATAAMPDASRAQLRALLAWARSKDGGQQAILTACGGMKVSDVLATGLTDPVKQQLHSYAMAAAKATSTAEVDPTADLAKAQGIGADLLKLEPALTPGVCHAVLRKSDNYGDALDRLRTAGQVDELLRYVSTCAPLLESPREVDSFLAMQAEKVDFATMKTQLKGHVRNLHRFEKAALTALVANLADTSKSKPLFLILHSNLDHNGAFHRDPNITAVITNAKHLTLMIEGAQSLADLGAELGPLAATYGRGGKISQVMIAGHGNTDVIQLAGTVDPNGLATVPFGTEINQGEKSADLSSAPGGTKDTDAFMKILFANMANDPDSRIVLNGCLTASQGVSGPLDPDPAKAAAQVTAAVKAEPSLVNYLRTSATASGSNAKVMGANASFGQVGLQDAAGNLDIVAEDPKDPTKNPDPKLTASKLEYVRGGTEPLGVLRAVLEVWAQDLTATPPTRTMADTVHDRVTKEKASTVWNPLVIQTLLKIVDGAPDNAEQTRQLAGAADALGGISEGSYSVPALDSQVPHALIPTIYTAMKSATSFAEPAVALTIWQSWMLVDNSKKADFLAALQADPLSDATKYVHRPTVSALMAQLLPLADAAHPSNGQLKLALLAVTSGGVDPQAKAFLLAVVGKKATFDPALGIDGLLDSTATVNDVEVAIGLRGGGGGGGGGGRAAPPANVSLDRDKFNDLHVESMTATGTVTARRLNVRERPSLGAAVVAGLAQGDTVDILGSTTFWYAITLKGRTRFVARSFVNV